MVQEADDFSIVRAFEQFHNQLVSGLRKSPEELLSSQSVELNDTFDSEKLEWLIINKDRQLSPEDSVKAARLLLDQFASDPNFSELVVESLQEWEDDRQLVGEILALGTVGAVWMCLASSEFTYNNGKFKIHKKATTAEQLSALADLAKSLFSR